jgi:cell division septation protein DedD
MAKRRKKRTSRRRTSSEYPGWLWMIFGLAIGLSVAFAVYVRDRDPGIDAVPPAAASLPGERANNGETADTVATAADTPKSRFDFYTMLPAFEMLVDDDAPDTDKGTEALAIDEPGLYMLQAGSFSTHSDADRRRVDLALHGIESRIQRARVKNRDYYRIYVGPFDDLDELNMTLSQLRAADIDVLRIRLGE